MRKRIRNWMRTETEKVRHRGDKEKYRGSSPDSEDDHKADKVIAEKAHRQSRELAIGRT
jgi:hypothetical protein